MKKWWVFTALALTGITGGLLFFLRSSPKENSRFLTTPLAKGSILNTITSTGTLEPLQTVEVGTQVSGIIADIFTDYNDTVHKDQIIALLDKTTLSSAVDEAIANQTRAQALFHQAEAEYRRNKPLFEKSYISTQAFTAIETSYLTQKASLAVAEAAVKKARTNLQYATIRSPVNGTVIKRTIEKGQTVAASFSAPTLFVIAEDLNKMQILANVDEADIGKIKNNQPVHFSVQAYPDSQFSGTVRQIRLQPVVQSNVVTYTVVVETTNPHRILLPGMTATINFILERVEDVFVVPGSALRLRPTAAMQLRLDKMREQMRAQRLAAGGRTADTGQQTAQHGERTRESSSPILRSTVWYLDKNGEAMPLPVRTGISDGKLTQISSREPLAEGMTIITGIEAVEKQSRKQINLLPTPQSPRGTRRPH